MFNKKSILITGGTGSLGNALVKRLIREYKPSRLIIFSRDEVKQLEMRKIFPEEKYKFMRYFLGDVRDALRVREALRGVDYVVHAAALKQVPSGEYNPIEIIKTNIYGAQNIIEGCIANDIKQTIALSTDKAANPINLYGASKLASDKLFVAANNISGKNKNKFSVVRYGNVTNSRGSVVPIFRDIIKRGEKFFPITDKRMTRFWITLDQGVDFVLNSFKRMHGGEIFVPKIPSIYITDLAKSFSKKLPLKEIGIRPGEKLHEIMCPRDDSHLTIEFKDHYVIKPSINFFDQTTDYKKNKLGEKGKKVQQQSEYTSDKNKNFLKISDIRKVLNNIKI